VCVRIKYLNLTFKVKIKIRDLKLKTISSWSPNGFHVVILAVLRLLARAGLRAACGGGGPGKRCRRILHTPAPQPQAPPASPQSRRDPASNPLGGQRNRGTACQAKHTREAHCTHCRRQPRFALSSAAQTSPASFELTQSTPLGRALLSGPSPALASN